MQKSYKYVNMQGMYIGIERNIFILTWLLFFRTKAFNLHVQAHNKIIRLLPKGFAKAIRVSNIVRVIFLLKYISKEDRVKKFEVIESPHKGDILISTSNGYKVFDLSKQIVATQYQPQIKADSFQAITDNIGLLEKYAVSPRIKAIDKENLCIYEEYVNLYKAQRFYPITSYFYTSILPVWQRNMERFESRETEVVAYAKNQRSFIFERLELLSNQPNNKKNIIEIKNYIDHLVKRIIKQHSSSTVRLSLSHGDLHAWNILKGKNVSVIIDWDTAKERSILHDFYYMFFHNIFGREDMDYSTFITELNKGLKKVKADYTTKTSIEFDESLYRDLFYLEYIYLDLEKRMDTYTEEKRKNNFVEKLYGYIEVFSKADAVRLEMVDNKTVKNNMLSEKAE